VPASWAQLRALRTVWLRPGNYQLCSGAPARSRFTLCKELHDACLPQASLGQTCDLRVPMALSLPAPTATVTMLQARPAALLCACITGCLSLCLLKTSEQLDGASFSHPHEL